MRGEDSADADLEYWLSRWASWMRWNAGERPDGYPTAAAGFENSVSNFAVAEDDAETYWDTHMVPTVVRAIDAAIDSLEPDQKRAVWWKYGLTRIDPPRVAERYEEAFGQVRIFVLRRIAIAA
jgi:hypothetical protein